MTLLPAPAQAGHWVFTTTASGQSTLDGQHQRTFYISPQPTTNSVSTGYALAASESYGPATGAGPPVTETATSDITISVKAVWTADGNSDDTAPPPGIYFSEDTTATGTFSSNGGATQASTKVDDGFKDPITQSGSSIGTAAQVHYVKSSGGSATATLTASVTSTGTTGAQARRLPSAPSPSASTHSPTTFIRRWAVPIAMERFLLHTLGFLRAVAFQTSLLAHFMKL